VLSHPLLVEAAEALFVPVCIYNNTKGDHDQQVLKSFDEPAWNNPVVRILDFERNALAERIGKHWTVEALATAMVVALRKQECEVPDYLALLAVETTAHRRGVETAIFGMD
jgi:hypothetical protein